MVHFVIRWQGFREAQLNGASYGQRDKEFLKVIEPSKRTSQKFCGHDGHETRDADSARLGSRARRSHFENARQLPPVHPAILVLEFVVPKHGYVASRGGWFSDRSVCYS